MPFTDDCKDARRPPTKADDHLTTQQEMAADLLATGHTVTAAADAIGVCRQTVSEWLNQRHQFRIAVNQRRTELWAAAIDRLRSLVPQALEVLAADLEKNNSTTAAIAVLKAAGLHGLAAPGGAVTLEDALVEDQEREGTRRQRRTMAAIFSE